MKKIMKHRIVVLIVLMTSLTACFPEQEVSPVMDATEKAKITITRVDGLTTVKEGDIIEFEITSNKMLKNAIDFSTELIAEGADATDYEIVGGVLAPYTTSTTMKIHILDDGFPELAETLQLEIGAFDISQNWLLSPESDIATVNTGIENVNEAGVITVGLKWPDHDDDLDFFILNSAGENWGGNDAATGANPEINTNLWPSDPNGSYFVYVDPYHLEGKTVTDYSIHVGLEDGTVQVIDGVLDINNEDIFDPGEGLFKLLQIDILDGVVTIINLNP